MRKTVGIILRRNNAPPFFTLLNPLSYLIKINASFARANGKEIYSGEIPQNSLKIQQLINQVDPRYTVSIKGLKYLIVGFDMTGDYLYPITDEKGLKVDTKEQVIAFANNYSFSRVHEFEPIKNYLLIKTYPGISISEMKDKITKILEDANITNANSKIYAFDEIDPLNPERALRLITSLRLVETIKIVSIILTVLTTILILAALSFVSRRFVKSRQRSLGILLSLGYRKFEIAAAFLPFSAFFSIIGSLMGIVVGVLIKQLLIVSTSTF